MIRVSRFSVRKEDQRNILTVEVNPEEYREGADVKGRGDWSQEALAWVAGGGSYLINRRWIVLVKRSEDAPSNANRWTLPTGLADSYDELVSPGRVIRELFEEVVLVNSKREIIVPEGRLFEVDPEKTAVAAARRASVPFETVKRVSGKLLPHFHTDQICVKTPDGAEVSKTQTLLSFFPPNVNLLFALEVHFERGIEGITGFDTEFSDGKSLAREVMFYDLCQPAENQKEITLTAHAEFFIRRLDGIVNRGV